MNDEFQKLKHQVYHEYENDDGNMNPSYCSEKMEDQGYTDDEKAVRDSQAISRRTGANTRKR